MVNNRTLLCFRMDYPSLYMCKSKRGIKREDGGKVRSVIIISYSLLRRTKCLVY